MIEKTAAGAGRRHKHRLLNFCSPSLFILYEFLRTTVSFFLSLLFLNMSTSPSELHYLPLLAYLADEIEVFLRPYYYKPLHKMSDHPTSKLSRYSAWLAHAFALTSLGLVIAWAGGKDTSAGFLGGFNWTNLTFNYHPVMMVGGLLVAGTEAMLAFRFWPFGHFYNKVIHVIHMASFSNNKQGTIHVSKISSV